MKSIKLVVLALIALAAGASAWTQDGIPRPEKPVAQLEAQTARDPNNPRLLQQIGTAYFYQARDGNVAILAKAITALERSVALAPDDAASQRTLGVAYLMKVGVLSQSQSSPQEVMATVERALATFEQVLVLAELSPLVLPASFSVKLPLAPRVQVS